MRYKAKKRIDNYTWLSCTYIWKIELFPKIDIKTGEEFKDEKEEWSNRIVLYEGTVLEDLWDTVKCIMMDRYIYVSDSQFMITLPKNKIKLTK